MRRVQVKAGFHIQRLLRKLWVSKPHVLGATGTVDVDTAISNFSLTLASIYSPTLLNSNFEYPSFFVISPEKNINYNSLTSFQKSAFGWDVSGGSNITLLNYGISNY